MRFIGTILLLLRLAVFGLGQNQQPISDEHKKHVYNVTLDFDELPTNASGVGFHPTDPKQPAQKYKSVYLQSFTLLNASSANLSPPDKLCSKSWPNAIYASRKDGYAWPRISLHDMSKPHDEVAEAVLRSHFDVVSFWIKPTGYLTGQIGETLLSVLVTMLKLNPDPVSSPLPPGVGYPGIVRGSPDPLPLANATLLGIFFGPGSPVGFPINLREIFGGRVGAGVDVIEVTANVMRLDKKKYQWTVAEDWQICMDDIVLEVVEKGGRKKEEGEDAYSFEQLTVGIKADESLDLDKETEYEILEILTKGR